MTTTFTPDTTLARLVTERPHLTARLEQLGLDYCCGGGQTLAEATRARGLVLDDVLDVLNTDPDPAERPDWTDLGPAELADHIEATHHATLHAELRGSMRSPRRSPACTATATPS